MADAPINHQKAMNLPKRPTIRCPIPWVDSGVMSATPGSKPSSSRLVVVDAGGAPCHSCDTSMPPVGVDANRRGSVQLEGGGSTASTAVAGSSSTPASSAGTNNGTASQTNNRPSAEQKTPSAQKGKCTSPHYTPGVKPSGDQQPAPRARQRGNRTRPSGHQAHAKPG